MSLTRKKLIILGAFLLALFEFPVDSKAQEKECDGTIDVNKVTNTLINRIKLSGYAQCGFNYNDQESPNNEFKISRIILMANGQITNKLNMYFMYDFYSTSMHELYLNYHLSPAFNIRMGEFKTPFSIENPLSPTILELISPTSLVTSYMIGGGNQLMMPGCSGRDEGLNMYGSLFHKVFDYSLAIMNGQGRNKGDANAQKDFVAKISLHPTSWFMISTSIIKGTGNTAVVECSSAPSVYTASIAPDVTGFKSNGNYVRDRYSAGGCIDTDHFSLRSEYMHGKDADSKSNGCYATACIKRIFTNFDAVLSYDHLKIYSGKEDRYSAGVQYWFYPKCRFQVGYSYETADAVHDRNCILTQLQVRF